MTSIQPSYPQEFPFYLDIQVRYADLDTLQHVNNVAIMDYVEQARIAYYRASGIWDGTIHKGFGTVVAGFKIDYLVSILYDDPVRVGVMVSHIGNKSIRYRFQVENSENGTVFARGEVVVVSFNHETGESQPVPQEWREKIAAFENNQEFLA